MDSFSGDVFSDFLYSHSGTHLSVMPRIYENKIKVDVLYLNNYVLWLSVSQKLKCTYSFLIDIIFNYFNNTLVW